MRSFTILALCVMLLATACFGSDEEETPTTPDSQGPSSIITPTPSPVPDIPARVTVDDARGRTGETVTVDVALHNAIAGVSGFALEVASSDANVARITSVSMPEYGLTVIGDLPAPSVGITAADLPDLLQGAFERATLLSLDMELLNSGDAQILIDLRVIDDDNGNLLLPEVINGTISVN